MAGKNPSTYNEQAEQAVIGSILMAPNTIHDVLEVMRSDAFWKPAHQTIFEAAVSLNARGEPVDATTVAVQLQTDGNLNRTGGAPYLLTCMESTPTAANVTYYAKTVENLRRMRRLDELCAHGRELIRDGLEDPHEVISRFEQFLDESNLAETQGLQGFGDVYDEWVQWMAEDIHALPTPWANLNTKLAGGLHRQRLYIVGARPGCGKSVLGLNIAAQIAMAGYRGIIFSLEMPKTEVMSRMLAAGARADYGELTRREMSWETMNSVGQFMAQNPGFQTRVLIDDQVDHSIESIMHVARAQKRKGLDFIFIDYVQLLESSGHHESRYQELGVMSKMAKQMARKLDIAVLIAAQLNREPEKQGRLPSMSDLRESGNLEADADAVLMLSRGGAEDLPEIPMITMSIVKNRTGVAPDMLVLPEHFEQARLGA
jgi:replicative DNA helicase